MNSYFRRYTAFLFLSFVAVGATGCFEDPPVLNCPTGGCFDTDSTSSSMTDPSSSETLSSTDPTIEPDTTVTPEESSSSTSEGETSSSTTEQVDTTGEPHEPVNALWHFDGVANGANWPAPWVATLNPMDASVSNEQGQIIVDNGTARLETSGDTSNNTVTGFTGTMEGLDQINTFEAQLDVVAPLLSNGSQSVALMARVSAGSTQGLGVRLNTADNEIQLFNFVTGEILASAPMEFIAGGNPIGHFRVRLSLSNGVLTGSATPYIDGELEENATVQVDSDVTDLVADYEDGGRFVIDVQSIPPSPVLFDNIQITETAS